jgi:hypothetical protein
LAPRIRRIGVVEGEIMKLTGMVIICAMWIGLGVGRAQAADNPAVVPFDPTVYGNLAANWWEWAAETQANKSAVLDTTGKYCGSNQKGNVFFLAGTLDGSSVTRNCTSVPAGTFLFFPLSNDFYGAFLTDPADQRTPAFVREQVACMTGAVVTATIDGVPVNDPEQYLEESALFSLQLPTKNIFGVTAAQVPQLTLSPAADQGYYLLLKPLSRGTHSIQFTAEPGTSCGGTQNVSYTLYVQ